MGRIILNTVGYFFSHHTVNDSHNHLRHRGRKEYNHHSCNLFYNHHIYACQPSMLRCKSLREESKVHHNKKFAFFNVFKNITFAYF